MDKVDVIEMFAAIASLYPTTKAFSKPDDVMVQQWASALKDLTKSEVAIALKIHVSRSPLTPTVADLRKAVAEVRLSGNERQSGLEAWNLVSKALRRSAYRSAEEFAKLPPMCQRLIGSPTQLKEWALCEDESVVSVAKSQFIKAYEIQTRREEELSQLPESMRKLLASTTQGLLLGG